MAEPASLVPQLPFGFAQAVVGCMIARVLTSTVLHSFLHQWPLFLGISLLVIVASCVLGWIISKFRILPETTAIWGLLPGAASFAMMVMADAWAADARLVVFMQYVRVVMVAIVASIIAACVGSRTTAIAAAAQGVWFAPIHALPLIETLVLIVAAVVLAPVSAFSGRNVADTDVLVGAGLQINSLVEIELAKLAAGGQLSGSWVDDRIAVHPGNSAVCYSGFTETDGINSDADRILWRLGLRMFVEVFRYRSFDGLSCHQPGQGELSVAIIAASTNHRCRVCYGAADRSFYARSYRWSGFVPIRCGSNSYECSKYFRQNSHLSELVAED